MSTNAEIVILILCVGNLAQPIFWFWVIRQLIDRVMSKNYPEFVQTQVYSKKAEQNTKSLSLRNDDEDEEAAILRELNTRVSP